MFTNISKDLYTLIVIFCANTVEYFVTFMAWSSVCQGETFEKRWAIKISGPKNYF